MSLFHHMVDVGDAMTLFWREQSHWSQATFGADSERGPVGPLKHLAKEVQEALANPTDAEEYADLFILTCDAARRSGLSLMGLLELVQKKLEKNQGREWQKPVNPDEPVEHVR